MYSKWTPDNWTMHEKSIWKDEILKKHGAEPAVTTIHKADSRSCHKIFKVQNDETKNIPWIWHWGLFLAIISPILTVSKNVLFCLIGLTLKIFRVPANYMATDLLVNV